MRVRERVRETGIGAALVLGAWLLLVGQGTAQESAAVQLGHEYFMHYCASCHGTSAKGDGPLAPALRTRPPDLTTLSQRAGGGFPALAVAEVIDGRRVVVSHGSAEMPVWGRRFSSQGSGPQGPALRGRVAVIVEYLESIQVKK